MDCTGSEGLHFAHFLSSLSLLLKRDDFLVLLLQELAHADHDLQGASSARRATVQGRRADLVDTGEPSLDFVYHVLGPVDELAVDLSKPLQQACRRVNNCV